jgi:hypothetical protein
MDAILVGYRGRDSLLWCNRWCEVTPKAAVVEIIARLQRGYTTGATGWKLVMDDFDQEEMCSRHEAFSFQLKCRYVSLSLRYTVEDMPLKTWLSCFSEAIDSIY